ncbi:MAG TPA: DUF2510 domain-containing protein [Terrimesophilobacter sp.]|uniref:DUF2510 domain-containing protein n=1 Tax=Terrimesophilobacter sp. TaxID=2906435 RepID=UPI002F94F4F6
MDDNSFYGAPAGWYPDPLGLPQLRWWDSTAWTHQTAEARAPMVMQETTFAWPEDELDQDQDLLTRRERRERERRDGNDAPPPTALTLLQLEPPSVSDVQVDVPEPSPFSAFDAAQDYPDTRAEIPNPMSASRATSLQDQQADSFPASSYDDVYPATSYAEPATAPEYPQQDAPAFSFFTAEDAEQPRQSFDWAQQPAQPQAAYQEPAVHGRQPRRQTQSAQGQPHGSTNNGAVWMIALIPLVQLVLSLLVLTAFGTADASWVMAAIWLAPYPVVVGLAALDRASLRKSGHEHTAHWLWALLTAPIYLVVRAVASIRESGGGFGPVLVWFALGLLQIGSIVAVPGLLISTVPAVFAGQAEQSIVSDAAVIGSKLEVTCPTSPPVLIGQTFNCSGLQSSGENLDIEVSLQRVNGWIDWRVDDWGIYTIG